jgi:hypothetical protein
MELPPAGRGPARGLGLIRVPPSASSLAEVYFYAKAVILFYETHEQKKAVSAITELRDALDHLMLADVAQTDGDTDRVRSNVTSAEEHLRRAAMEPMEHAVENKIADLLKRYDALNLHRILFIPGPRQDEIADLFGEVYHALEEARQCKNPTDWKQGLNHLVVAYEYAIAIDRALPARELYLGRLFQIACTVCGAILSLIAYLIWQWLSKPH